MLEEHVSHTNSTRAIHVLKHFDRIEDVVVKVIPKDYQLMMQKFICTNHYMTMKMKRC